MPLDANIPLQFKPYQPPNLIEQQANIAMLQKAQAEADRFRTEQLQQRQMRDIMAQNITTDEAGNTSLNRRGVLNALLKVAPTEALKIESDWRKADLDEQKGLLESRKAQIEGAQKQLDYEMQLLGSAVDQPSWSFARNTYAANGGDISRIPEFFDPGLKQQYQMMGLKQKEQLDAQNQAILTAETLRKNRVDEEFKGAEFVRDAEEKRVSRSKEQFSQEKTLRDENIKADENYKTIDSSYKTIQQFKNAPSGQRDVADRSIISSYMKMLNPDINLKPGQMVDLTNMGGLAGEIAAQWNYMMSGGQLPTELRKQYLDGAEKLYEQAKTSRKSRISDTRALAERNQLNLQNIIPDYKGISRARVERLATKSGKSEEEVARALEATGFSIEDD